MRKTRNSHENRRLGIGPLPIVVDPAAGAALAITILSTLFIIGVALAPPAMLRMLQGEDGVVETVSALAYIAGLFFALRLAGLTRGWSRAHWVMWAILCFTFFGEETSWLQHWIGYATPESVKAVNVQSEFNLHNLALFSPDDRVFSGQGISFSWKFLMSAQHLFNIGFTAYFLLLPVVMLLRPIGNRMRRFGVPQIRLRFVATVWLPLIVSVALTITERSAEATKALIGETREMFFALTIMWLIVSAYNSLLDWKRNAGSMASTRRRSGLPSAVDNARTDTTASSR